MPQKKTPSLETAVALLTQKIDDLTDYIKVEHKEDMVELKAKQTAMATQIQTLRENQIRFRGTIKTWGIFGGALLTLATSITGAVVIALVVGWIERG